jgi:peroxiredoxin
LLDFQRHLKEFDKKGVQIIAASSDSWENALRTVERYKLAFRVGYGLDPRDFSSKTGAFYNEKDNYIYAAGFVISPEGKVENAVYSSRSIGRLTAKECLDFIGS